MKCYVHPERDAVATCSNCGRGICGEDAIDVEGSIVCRNCLQEGRALKQTSADTSPINPLAIASLGLGLLGICGSCCGGPIGSFIFGIPATITGWIARKQIIESGVEDRGLLFATIGLVLGIGMLLFTAVVFIFYGGTTGLAFLSELFSQ